MKAPLLPPDEEQRMTALRKLEILDTPAEERFDRITRLASRIFNVPIALVSLVDEGRQWFKSDHGLDRTETSREVSFCGHAILSDETFVVRDAASDPRFADNPLVTGAPNLRFYSGIPLHAAGGARVGTLCVMDRKPRSFGLLDVQALEDLGRLVETELQQMQLTQTQRSLLQQLSAAERRAAVDSLTRLWNREVILGIAGRELEQTERGSAPFSLGVIDVGHFKRVNDVHGHAAGDEVLRQVCAGLRKAVRPYDSLGRIGGEEFLVVLPGCGVADARLVAERMREAVAHQPIPLEEGKPALEVRVSIGLCTRSAWVTPDLAAMVEAADRALYAAKARGRDRVCAAGEEEPSSVPPAQ